MKKNDDIRKILDDMEPAEGHFDRFLEKANPPKRIEFRRNAPRKRVFWKAVLFPVAASLMLIWGANLILKTLDTKDVSFSDKVALMDNPYDVYNAYMDVVKESFEHLSSLTAHNPHNEVSEHFNTLENITLEYVPLLDALPVEMSEREKAEILKEYYNRRVASAMELRKYVTSLVK
ncbi:MAG: hypothetical protein GX993_03755 [Bacteroidales bacterium]|nr:hypothetical protein [Bacteroidales bacterium]